MNRSKYFWIIGIVILLALILLLLLLRKEEAPIQPLKKTISTTVKEANSIPKTPPTEMLEEISKEEKIEAIKAKNTSKEEVLKELLETPITFYGKVVDENNIPIEDAFAKIDVTDQLWESGSSYERKTNSKGIFSIDGIKGVALYVRTSKEGYHKLGEENGRRGSNGKFDFNPLNATTKQKEGTQENPAIFRLKKKIEAEPIVYTNRRRRLPNDGKIVKVPLTNSEDQFIEVSFWKQFDSEGTNRNRYSWKFNLSVPGGGVAEKSGQLQLTAPDQGYAESYEIDMPSAPGGQWKKVINEELFLKFSNNTYARVAITVASGGGDIVIKSYYNPSGSRNLEFDKSKRVQ